MHTYTQQGNTYIKAQHIHKTYTQPVQTARPTGRQAIRKAYRHAGTQGAMGRYIQAKWKQPIQKYRNDTGCHTGHTHKQQEHRQAIRKTRTKHKHTHAYVCVYTYRRRQHDMHTRTQPARYTGMHT